MLERFSELGKYLSGVMKGYRVEIVPMTDTELEQALGTGQVDFILTNPAHYIALREYGQLSGVLSSMVLRDGDAPIHSIGGVILRRQERQGIDRLADLRGKRIAIAGKSFLGTYMAPAAELVRAGVPLEAVTFMETAQPVDQVITAVLEGRADAGFVRTGLLEQLERERIACEAWAYEPIEPFLTIRYIPGVYGVKEVPKAFCTPRESAEDREWARERAEDWAAAELRRFRAKGFLNWSRRERTWFDQYGLNPDRRQVTFESRTTGAWMQVSESQQSFLLGSSGELITRSDGLDQP
jgi:ABC-type nitrate/sulfonate/bicarbonate transport system substrate-binding protein